MNKHHLGIRLSFLFLVAILVMVAYRLFLEANGCKPASLQVPTAVAGSHILNITMGSRVNTFHIGQVVILSIQNSSSSSIWFPPLREIGIYQLDACGNPILEIDDLVENDQAKEVILGPKGSDTSMYAEWIEPSIGSGTDSVNLGVYVGGYIYENGKPTSKKVVGYVEFTLINR